MMSYPPHDPPPYRDSLHPSRHTSKPSVDTNASGIADSTISFSAFPPPPSSIPTTPITASAPSLSSSSSRTAFASPVRPLIPRKIPSTGGRPLPDPLSATSATSDTTLAAGGSARPFPSAYSKNSKWMNDGASQISGISAVSVDAADDKLLPTSFITSLLQENKEARKAQRRNSTASDALSGISEMTYPPPEDHSRYRAFRAQPSRLGASPAPPSSFSPIPEMPHSRASSDSDTLASAQGYSATKSSPKRGPSLVGVAHASYRKIPEHTPRTPQTFPMSVSGHGHEKDGSYDEDDDDSIMQYKAALEPRIAPLPPSEPMHRRIHSRSHQYNSNPEARQSVHSFKSVAPSFISRISIPNSIRRFIYRRQDPKPLPPVPIIPDIPLAVEAQYRRQDEVAPLPELVNRAGQLQYMLEKEQGHHHQESVGSYFSFPKSETTLQTAQTFGTRAESWQPLRRRDVAESTIAGGPPPNSVYLGDAYGSHGGQAPKGGRCCVVTRRVWITVGVAAALVLIVAIVVPVVVTKKRDETPTCEPGVTGSLCDLNTSCVCTGPSGTCNGLAQSIIDLVPVLNDKFSTNFTNADIYTNLWYAQGAPGSKDCTQQASLVDSGKALASQTYPDRTRWTRAALLWNVVRSQDVEAANSMQKFVQKLPWSNLGSDGPIDSDTSTFTSTFAGYTYNFAKQTISQPSTSFVNQGQPLSAQVARVGQKAQGALDHIYTYALASSTQREVALKNYWTTTLAQRAEDLTTFKGVFSRSPILLPFNGSSTTIRSLYNSSSLLFPPPLACYPGFSPDLLSLVQTFETTVFNLDNPAAASSFDAACFPDRPIYGILDLLRLRLPYLEDRPWLPRQAAVLKVDALPRAVVYVNEMLSSTFPGSTPRAKFTQSDLDPRNYGTLNLPSHVILQYLSSMPVETAKTLAQFVVNAVGKPAVPPELSSPLLKTLSSIPPLEVAVFGNIGPTDVSGTVTSFMTASGRFFFGTDAGSALRNWTITTAGGSVAWAENSTSPRVVRDNSLADTTFDQAWRAVAARLDDGSIGLSNLTVSFEQTRKFSSS